MKLVIASDHAAFEAKQTLVNFLKQEGHDVLDVGTHSLESTHYPEWAKKLVAEVLSQKIPGILLCGSGIGVSMTANRFKGIRAALCHDEDDAKMSRLHNNANVICLAGRKTNIDQLKRMVNVFLTTSFEGGRHQLRLDQFNDLGSDC